MASMFGHAAVALALGTALRPGRVPRRFWILGALCAVLPDLDAIGRPFGSFRAESLIGGHRGITHSLLFAVLLGAAIAWGAFRGPTWSGTRGRLWLCFALATASHGLVDMLTSYGEGVALLAPFSWQRFTAAWHPIDSVGASGACRGLVACVTRGMLNELFWLGLPSLLLAAAVWVWRRMRGASIERATGR